MTSNASYRGSVLALGLVSLIALTACEKPEVRADAHMQRGIELYKANKLDQARLEFRNTLQITPTNADAYYYLGLIYDRQRSVPDAARAFVSALAQNPDHQDANIRMGRYYVVAGGYKEALAHAERVIRASDGKNAEGYALRASINAAKGDLDAAEADARQALELDRNNVTAIGALAGVFSRRGDVQEAIDLVAAGIRANPEDPSLRIAKMGYHLALKQRDLAEAEALALIGMDPDKIWQRVQLGRLYVEWGRIDDAEALLREGAERRPATTEAKLALVDLLVNRRGFDAARTALNEFIAGAPKEYQLRFALAELYRLNAKPEEAKATLREIMTQGKGTPVALSAKSGLAGLLYASGEKAEAKKLVAEVLKAEPENAQALLLRGRIQFEERQIVQAIDSFRTILRNAPDSIPALSFLAQAHMRNGQWQLAADTLRKQIEVDPRNVAARIELAQLLASNNQPESALKVLNDALVRTPRDVAVLATKVDILLGLNRTADARSAAGPIGDQPPARALYLTLMGRIAAAEGNHEEAIAAFQLARAADPEQWAPVNGMVRSMSTRGEFDRAESVLREILEQRPGDPVVSIRLGDVQMARRDFDAAAATYDSVIAAQPTNTTAYQRLFGLYYAAGEEDKALNVLQRAATANPADTSTRTMYGLGLERAGRFQDAISVYEALNSDGVKSVVVTNNLAALIADHDYTDPARVGRAIKMMEPLQATDNALVVDTIGWLHYRAGRTAEALSFLKRAVALDPKNPLLQRHLGEAYQRAGDQDMARRYLVEAP